MHVRNLTPRGADPPNHLQGSKSVVGAKLAQVRLWQILEFKHKNQMNERAASNGKR